MLVAVLVAICGVAGMLQLRGCLGGWLNGVAAGRSGVRKLVGAGADGVVYDKPHFLFCDSESRS